MSNETFMALPDKLDDPITVKRALQRIIEEVDKILGNRGSEPYLTIDNIAGVSEETLLSLQEVADLIANLQEALAALELNNTDVAEILTQILDSIEQLQNAGNYTELADAFQDFNDDEWFSFAGKGVVSGQGSSFMNEPGSFIPGDEYNVYADSAPTPGGGISTTVTVENVTKATLEAHKRSGYTKATTISNGWLAL